MAAPPPPLPSANGTPLTIEDAGHILSRYLKSFGQDPSSTRQIVTYTTLPAPDPPLTSPPPTGLCFGATLELPPIAKSAIYSTTLPYCSKLMAKRVACFEACKDLHSKGELDDNFRPRPNGGPPPEKKMRVREGRDPASLSRWLAEGDIVLGPEDGDLQRGLSLSARWMVFKDSMRGRMPEPSPGVGAGPAGVGEYDAIVPEGLDEVVGRRPWMTALQFPGERCLGILSSKKLADGEEELALRADASIRMVDLGQLKKLSEEQYELASQYTEQAIRSQMNKDLHLPASGPCWLIVPLLRTYQPGSKANRSDVDWAEMTTTLSSLPATSTPFTISDDDILAEELVDAVATNPQEFGRRFFVTSITDLSPYSPHPLDPNKSVLQYAFPRSIPPTLEYPGQCVFTVSIATSGRSGGIMQIPTSTSNPLYLIPEVTQRYCFPATTFRTLSLIPSFFIILTELLGAKQFNRRVFDNELDPKLALQALTPPMTAPNQPHRSYERLEILGDTLIKLLTTLDTCLAGPLSDNSRVERHILLSNKSLRINGVEAGIAPYIRAKEGRPKAWLPEGWTLDDQPTPVAGKTVKIGDKVVADVVESLVGAAYISGNRSLSSAISSMRRLKIPIDHLESWSDVSKLFERRSSLDLEVTPAEPESTSKKSKGKKKAEPEAWMEAFTKAVDTPILGYTFRDPEKAKLVFNASSQTRGRQDFQQYKIIGDSLLDYFVVEKLYDMEEHHNPAVITHMKHSRNADQSLAAMCVALGLADRTTEMDRLVDREVKRYKAQVGAKYKEAENILKKKSRMETVDGEEEVLVDGKVTEFWNGTSHAPTLGAMPEVLLGAAMADQNGDLSAARQLFTDHYWPFMQKFGVGPIYHSLHPKSVMSEMMGKYGCTVWKIQRLDSGDFKGVICAVTLHGQEIARGTAESQVLATRAACENVLAILTQDLVKGICVCRPERAKAGEAEEGNQGTITG